MDNINKSIVAKGNSKINNPKITIKKTNKNSFNKEPKKNTVCKIFSSIIDLFCRLIKLII